MGRGFSEREKTIIKDRLIAAGREYFSRYGLKKTAIADLTRAAGIAQGSFYLFFDSKEELCLEVLEREEREIREHFMSRFFAPGEMSKTVFKEFLAEALRVFEKNSLIRRLYMDDDYELLARKIPEERIKQHIKVDDEVLAPFIISLQEAGVLRKIDPSIITGMFRAMFFLPLHRKEIGEERFDDVLALFIEALAERLTEKGDGLRDH